MTRSSMALAVLVLLAIVGTAPAASALTVYLYADSAPNAYGSPAYTPWRTSAFAAAANGTFQNMQNGTFPGTNNYAATDAIVYSTGDLGKRLHWIYWIPGVTKDDLVGKFQVKDVSDWDGVDYTYDWSLGDLVEDSPTAGWIQPSSWINYTNSSGVSGVIGTFGDAFWAGDNEALPYSTDSNLWNETDAADIAALADQMYQYNTHWIGCVRFMDDAGQWQTQQLALRLRNPAVPEPMSVMLGIMGLGSVAGLRRLRRK